MSDEEWEHGSKRELAGSPTPSPVDTSARSPDHPSIASFDTSSPDSNHIPSGSPSLVISHRGIHRVLPRRVPNDGGDEPVEGDDLERGEEDDNNDEFDDDEEGEDSEDEEEEVAEYADGEEDDDDAGLELHQDPEMAYGVFISSNPRDLRILCLRLYESTLNSADIDVMVGEMWATLEAFGIIHLFVRETHDLLVVRPATSLASYNHLGHPRKAER
jgi:hypothetical protein